MCYWETQPVGCLKAHCPFMHQKPKPNSLEKMSEKSGPGNMLSDQQKVTAVDSLVVNFEEESDNDSMPTFSPTKSTNRVVTVKTLEDIRLENIQAESAAFYSCYNEERDLRSRIPYRMRDPVRKASFHSPVCTKSDNNFRPQKRLNDDEIASMLDESGVRDLRFRIPYRMRDPGRKVSFHPPGCTKSDNNIRPQKRLNDDEIASMLDDSGVKDLRFRIPYRMRDPGRKVSFHPPVCTKSDNNFSPQKRLNDDEIASMLGDAPQRKKRKIIVEDADGNVQILLNRKLSASQVYVTITPESRVVRETWHEKQNVSDIKIKTLAEIRAERLRRDTEEAEVSSTSAGYTPAVDQDHLPVQYEFNQQSTIPKKTIKLRRSQQVVTDDSVGNTSGSDGFKRSSLCKKDYGGEDEDLLEDKLLQDSDSDDLEVNLDADEDLLLEVDSVSDE
nr:unnamed protein product [Callosobruchus chinensis]